MPRYNYLCKDCENKADKRFGKKITQGQFEENVLFETSHAMEPTEEELLEAKKCPRCGGTNCEICLYGTEVRSYIRGYGWRDKEGARRDMHSYTLANDDPYAQYRVPGEVDDMQQKLKRAGQHGSAKPKHFVQDNKSMQKAVDKATSDKSATDS